MPTETDILIVGAGPAGSALAYFLASTGFSVRLLDKAGFPRAKTCGDGLSPRALQVLKNIGALEVVNAAGFRIASLRLFSPNGQSFSAPILPHKNLPGHALVLPRLQLDEIIRQRALAAGAHFEQQTVSGLIEAAGRVVGVSAGGNGSAPVSHRARVTVLATGASTALLERAGLLPANFTAEGRAARAYFQNVRGLSDEVEFHFDSVPLPGYGWVFPTSATTANVGAGYVLRNGRAPQATPRQTFDGFITNPYVSNLLAEAHAATPIKGFPLRFDFATAPTAKPGLFLVGEACGLVNPLTGEGVDYALESAEVAAEIISEALRHGTAPEQTARTYTRALRQRFLHLFATIRRVRDLYLQPWVLNRFVRAAQKNDDLKMRLVNIALGVADPLHAISPKTLWQVALG